MESIIKLRIILDATDDIFRDIEINHDAPLMHLHMATLDAFEWVGANEMAAFYKSNENWDRGDEFPLMAMSPELPSMESATVKDLIPDLQSRGLYVYDYLRMWCFYLEPLSISAASEGMAYPSLALEFGKSPDPLSKEPEGLDDPALMDAIFGDSDAADDAGGHESTGDPELDAYLNDDGSDDEAPGENENIDDYRDQF
jgi:hypothetical protein|tara:strand:- start:4202 stop:4798 length:597 start_codon:yes stop_codon:yes gene_type:complete